MLYTRRRPSTCPAMESSGITGDLISESNLRPSSACVNVRFSNIFGRRYLAQYLQTSEQFPSSRLFNSGGRKNLLARKSSPQVSSSAPERSSTMRVTSSAGRLVALAYSGMACGIVAPVSLTSETRPQIHPTYKAYVTNRNPE